MKRRISTPSLKILLCLIMLSGMFYPPTDTQAASYDKTSLPDTGSKEPYII
jgi:hypothetical protein